MKRLSITKTHVILSILLAMNLNCCDTYETPGGLEGMWQVQSVTDKLTGSTADVCTPYYYCFQMEMMTLDHRFITTFSIDSDSLRYEAFHPYHNDNERVVSLEEILPYDIERAPGAFAMKRKGAHLTLETSTKRLEFIKY